MNPNMGFHRACAYVRHILGDCLAPILVYNRACMIAEQLPHWLTNKDRIAMALAYHEFGFEMELSKTSAARWANES